MGVRLFFCGAILYGVKPAKYYLIPVFLAAKEFRGSLYVTLHVQQYVMHGCRQRCCPQHLRNAVVV